MQSVLTMYFITALICWPFITICVSWVNWMESNSSHLRISALHGVIALPLTLIPLVNTAISGVAIFILIVAASIWLRDKMMLRSIGKYITNAIAWLDNIQLWPR